MTPICSEPSVTPLPTLSSLSLSIWCLSPITLSFLYRFFYLFTIQFWIVVWLYIQWKFLLSYTVCCEMIICSKRILIREYSHKRISYDPLNFCGNQCNFSSFISNFISLNFFSFFLFFLMSLTKDLSIMLYLFKETYLSFSDLFCFLVYLLLLWSFYKDHFY